MIRLLWVDERDGERLLTVGLTDVNLKRLQAGQPVSLRPVAEGLEHDRLVIYHATRDSLIELADTLGVDQKVLLDQLGEG